MLLAVSISLKSQTLPNDDIVQYISQYADIAIKEMVRTGVPASIKIAQGILETQAGKSDLVLASNNHFGIKCKSNWNGPKVYHDDDAQNECFRKYKDAQSSYKDHSDFLKSQPRYSPLFDLDPDDYSGWAWGLKKAGYATDPQYAEKLISLIERFELDRYDNNTRFSKATNLIEHEVVKGDTLYSMSKKYNVSIEAILQFNNLIEPTIYLGQILQIPTP